MNKEVYRMLKTSGVWKMFLIMLILRSPFDILNSVLTANLMQSFIRMIENKRTENLWTTAALFFLFTILLFGYNMTVWSTIAVRATVKLQKNLRKKVFEKIMNLSSEELSGSHRADWFTRLNNDVDKACGYLTSPLNYMHMMIAIVNLVISSVIMIFMNLELYIIGICFLLPILAINILVISGKISVYKNNAQKALVEYTDLIDVAIKDKEALAVYDANDFILDKMEKKSKEILKENMKAHSRASLCNTLYAFSGMIGYLFVLLKGNDIIGKGIKDLGALLKMTQYRSRTVMSANCIYTSVNNMRGSLVGVKRVNEIIIED